MWLFIKVCPCRWVKIPSEYEHRPGQSNFHFHSPRLYFLSHWFCQQSVVVNYVFYNCWDLEYHCGDPLPCTLFTFAAIETGDRAICVWIQASGGSPHHHSYTWGKMRVRCRRTGWTVRGHEDVLKVHLVKENMSEPKYPGVVTFTWLVFICLFPNRFGDSHWSVLSPQGVFSGVSPC